MLGSLLRPGEEYRSETLCRVYSKLDSNNTESASRLEHCAADARVPFRQGQISRLLTRRQAGLVRVRRLGPTLGHCDRSGAADARGRFGPVRSAAFSPNIKLVRTLFVFGDWVAEGGTNILWLPPDYRATCIAVWNGIVVLGHSSGRITFLEFKEGPSLYDTE